MLYMPVLPVSVMKKLAVDYVDVFKRPIFVDIDYFEKDQDYRNFILQVRKTSGYNFIVGNSLLNHDTLNENDFYISHEVSYTVEKSFHLRPCTIVIPSYYQNTSKTLESFEHFIDTSERYQYPLFGYTFMVVLQGKSINDILNCISVYSRSRQYISYIGIHDNYPWAVPLFPKEHYVTELINWPLTEMMKQALRRWAVVQHMLSSFYCPIHLFELCDPFEFILYETMRRRVLTVSGRLLFNCSKQGILLSNKGEFDKKFSMVDSSKPIFDEKMSDSEYKILLDNLKYFN